MHGSARVGAQVAAAAARPARRGPLTAVAALHQQPRQHHPREPLIVHLQNDRQGGGQEAAGRGGTQQQGCEAGGSSAGRAPQGHGCLRRGTHPAGLWQVSVDHGCRSLAAAAATGAREDGVEPTAGGRTAYAAATCLHHVPPAGRALALCLTDPRQGSGRAGREKGGRLHPAPPAPLTCCCCCCSADAKGWPTTPHMARRAGVVGGDLAPATPRPTSRDGSCCLCRGVGALPAKLDWSAGRWPGLTAAGRRGGTWAHVRGRPWAQLNFKPFFHGFWTGLLPQAAIYQPGG